MEKSKLGMSVSLTVGTVTVTFEIEKNKNKEPFRIETSEKPKLIERKG